MTLEYFVQQLERIKPSENLLIGEGFSGIHLTVFQNNYVLEKRSQSGNVEEGVDLIRALINTYETKYIRFKDYTFFDKVNLIDGVSAFCGGSNTALGYDSPLAEVKEYDADEMSIMHYCAENSAKFLAALLYVLELKSLRLQGLADLKDTTTNQKYLDLCTSSAGGASILNFIEASYFKFELL